MFCARSSAETEVRAGIAWDSIDFRWPVTDPVVSDRDRKFPALRDFASPF